MTSPDHAAVEAAEAAFNHAMVSNDPEQIARSITPDWVLVTSERGPIQRRDVLAAIGAGVLSHDHMVKITHHVHVMGDVAIITSRGQTPGCFAVNRLRRTSGSPMSITACPANGAAC